MARDRKRAKQRQQRRARAGSRAASTARERASERPDDDALAAPDPLEHASAAADLAEASPRGGNRFINFLRACVVELGRVQWPDRRAVTQATGVVLGFVVIAGAYLGLLDAVWSRVVDAIL